MPTGVLNIHGHLHGAKLASEQHYNISAWLVDYKPIDIMYFYQYVSKLPQGSERFLQEWYAADYVFLKPKDDVVMDTNGRILMEETKRFRQQKYNKE